VPAVGEEKNLTRTADVGDTMVDQDLSHFSG
jgi:hypothetical protein